MSEIRITSTDGGVTAVPTPELEKYSTCLQGPLLQPWEPAY